MKKSKRTTRIIRRMILNAVTGITGLISLIISWLAWPVYLLGVAVLTAWQYCDYKGDIRKYAYRRYNWTFVWIEWILGIIMFSFIFWSIAWGWGLR